MPLPEERRYLEVRVEAPGRPAESEEIRGTNRELVARLRAPQTMLKILAALERLGRPASD
jgi:hypothetical protein